MHLKIFGAQVGLFWFHTCCLYRKYSLTPLRSCIPLWDYGWFIFKARNLLFMLIYLPVWYCVKKMRCSIGGNSQHDAQEFLLWLWTEFTKTSITLWSRVASLLWQVRARPGALRERWAEWRKEGVNSSEAPLSSCCSLWLVNTVKLTKWVLRGYLEAVSHCAATTTLCWQLSVFRRQSRCLQGLTLREGTHVPVYCRLTLDSVNCL